MLIGVSAALLAVYLIWTSGRAHRRAMVPMPLWVLAFAAEVQPFIPVAIVAFYATSTWDTTSPVFKGWSAGCAAVQLVGWLLLSDDDDDRWKRRRRRLAERFSRRLASDT
jgi:hypothetical protein